jgi:hypothetical protein
MTALLLATLFLLQTTTGSLEGTVTRDGSSQAVSDARVGIWGDRGPDFDTRTDANGHFLFPNLPPGVYNIEIQAEGYVTAPNPSSNTTIRITVGNGQRVRRDVAITRIARLRGRIFGEDRTPLSGVSIEVLRRIRDLQGKPRWQGVASTKTKESGEYQVNDLAEGEYYIRAGKKGVASTRLLSEPAELAMTYFPGSIDPRTAASILLREGDEANAEFALSTETTHSISGTIEGLETDSQVRLFVTPQDSRVPLDELTTFGIGVGEKFQLTGLLPGIYDLFAIRFPADKVIEPATFRTDGTTVVVFSQGKFVHLPLMVARDSVEVRDADVQAVHLKLEPGVDVWGRISVNGSAQGVSLTQKDGSLGPINVTTAAGTTQIRVRLLRKGDVGSSLINPSISAFQDFFVFSDVPAGKYDVAVEPYGDARGIYVADFRAGPRSVFDEGLEISPQSTDPIEIVVGFDGGSVEGSVLNPKKASVLVVIAPQAPRRKNSTLFKTTRLKDGSVPFKFTDLSPGLYSVFAFDVKESENDDTVPYLDPDFLSLHENYAASVSVEKGATVGSVRVRLIPR